LERRNREAAALQAEASRQTEAQRAERSRAEQLRANLAATGASLAAMPCSLIAWNATPTSLTVSGVVRRGDDAAIWQQIAAHSLPPDAVLLNLRNFDGPYCAALDLLRPLAAAPNAMPQASIIGTLPLAKGELLRLDITTPPWPGHLYVSYLMQSGDVAHLVPSRPERADTVVRLGEPAGGFPGWEVDEPFGTDLILVFSSDRPIFAQPRPVVERSDDYLNALAVALREAQGQGARLAVRAVVLETVVRR
jgi:serine/threonine-protein kinase